MSLFTVNKSGKHLLATYTTSVAVKEFDKVGATALFKKFEQEIAKECESRGYGPPTEVIVSGQDNWVMKTVDLTFKGYVTKKGK